MPMQVNRAACVRRGCIALAALALGGAAGARVERPQDMILFHGRILTVDARDSVAEGLIDSHAHIADAGVAVLKPGEWLQGDGCTAWNARQLFLEDRTGTLEVGKDADIAVWDRDMYAIPARELRDLKCTMTLFKGRVVYDADQP